MTINCEKKEDLKCFTRVFSRKEAEKLKEDIKGNRDVQKIRKCKL